MEPYTLLLDGNNMAFRAAAVMDLTNEAGVNTSIPYGVIRMVRFCIEKFPCNDVIVIWDGGRSKARTSILPEYKMSDRRKKNRESFADKDIGEGISKAQDLLDLLDICQWHSKGFEADDIIASYVWLHQQVRTLIISSDKDFWQLINDRVHVFHPTRDVVITKENFSEATKLPISKDQYLDFLILNGDKSDNISGIPGVGEKTVLGLLDRYGSIEGIMKAGRVNPHAFNGRESKVITDEGREIISRNRMLVDLLAFVASWPTMPINNHTRKDGSFELFRRRIVKPDLGFYSIIKDFNFWVMPFRKLKLKSKYR